MVSCPICEEFVDADYINAHLDNKCSSNTREIQSGTGVRQNSNGTSKGPRTSETTQAKAWANVLGPRAAGKAK